MPEDSNISSESAGIEMPRPTAAPMITALGALLLAAGVALSIAMSIVGAAILIVGLAIWIGHLLPGRGHFHEQRAAPEQRPQAIVPTPGAVARLEAGMPGYRMRLPLKVHPISAGIKGGLLGGLLMPVPALTWGILSGHGLWYPINLLAGMLMAGVDDMPTVDLEKFQLSLLLVGIVIHVVMSLILGLIYGVLLPTLPAIRGGQIAWGGVLMPLLWTGFSYGLMGVVNPLLQSAVDWPWFIASQFVFGVTAAIVVIRTEKIAVPPAGMGPDTDSLTR
jgi:hypothetical protein